VSFELGCFGEVDNGAKYQKIEVCGVRDGLVRDDMRWGLSIDLIAKGD
jgi:hypothetical protein